VPVYTSEVVWPCFILIELITLIYQSNDEVTYPNNTSMGGGSWDGCQLAPRLASAPPSTTPGVAAGVDPKTSLATRA